MKNYLREKITIDYKLTTLFRPYLEAEVYYNIDKEDLNTYRLYLGSEFNYKKNELDCIFIVEGMHEKFLELFYILGIAYQFSIN